MDAFTSYGIDEHASTTYGNTRESSQLHQYGVDNLRCSTMLTGKPPKLRPVKKNSNPLSRACAQAHVVPRQDLVLEPAYQEQQ